MGNENFSRPGRLGALLTGESEEAVRHLFTEKSILVRLETPFVTVADARDTFLFVVNQSLRFCSNVSVCVEGCSDELIRACNSLAAQIHGSGAKVESVEKVTTHAFDAI